MTEIVIAIRRNICLFDGISESVHLLKKETERQCLARGASFFLEKSNDWQNELRNTIAGYINAEAPNDDF